MDEAGRLRGSRATATANAIESAALELVLDRGYEYVTVDLICAAARVSQRTFFNHFPTKDDAILGRDRPRVDERAARRFVVSDGPLISDALALIALPDVDKPASRIAGRMRAIALSPALLARQAERISELDAELTEIIALRLEHQRRDGDPREHESDAAMVSHLIGAVMRWVVGNVADEGGQADFSGQVARARASLTRILGPGTAVDAVPGE
jgi:AcrR family transcriptional regulator